jgi:hypothetical protein
MKLKNYLHPALIIKRFKEYRKILNYKKNYKTALNDIEADGKLKEIGFLRQEDTLLVGINLNEQLLTYDELTIETAELKYVADRLKVYTDFLQKEGILDSIFADYERVKTQDYYGYVIQIKFDDKKYNQRDYIYTISYLVGIPALLLSILALIFI